MSSRPRPADAPPAPCRLRAVLATRQAPTGAPDSTCNAGTSDAHARKHRTFRLWIRNLHTAWTFVGVEVGAKDATSIIVDDIIPSRPWNYQPPRLLLDEFDCSGLTRLNNFEGLENKGVAVAVFKGCTALTWDKGLPPCEELVFHRQRDTADHTAERHEWNLRGGGLKGFLGELHFDHRDWYQIRRRNGMRQWLQTVDFEGCTSLVDIPNYCFCAFRKLERVSFKGCAGVTSVGDSAFAGCAVLKRVDFTGCKVESIGQLAFAECPSLRLDESDDSCLRFKGVGALKEVLAGAFSTDDTLYAYTEGISHWTAVDFSGCSRLEQIKEGAFEHASRLTTVDFSGCESLRVVEGSAFKECVNLETVDFSGCESLESIADRTFSGCVELSHVNLSDSPQVEVGAYAFLSPPRHWRRVTVHVHARVAVRLLCKEPDSDECKRLLELPNGADFVEAVVGEGVTLQRLLMAVRKEDGTFTNMSSSSEEIDTALKGHVGPGKAGCVSGSLLCKTLTALIKARQNAVPGPGEPLCLPNPPGSRAGAVQAARQRPVGGWFWPTRSNADVVVGRPPPAAER